MTYNCLTSNKNNSDNNNSNSNSKMSKIQVPTGEVIVRSNGKKRFIMVEDKYQFDDDTWGLIKEFMGFIDFKSLFSVLRYGNALGYYINQIKFTNGAKRVCYWETYSHYHSKMIRRIPEYATEEEYQREFYALILVALAKFRMKREDKHTKSWTILEYKSKRGLAKKNENFLRLKYC